MKFTYRNFFLISFLLTFSALNLFAQNAREKGIESYKKGDYAEAARLLDSAIDQDEFKNDGEVWNYLGLAYVNGQKIKDGRKALEKAVKLAPQNSAYRANLAYAHLLEGKIDKAQSQAQKAISIDPKNATAYLIRGTSNLWESKNERAVSDAELAISLDPKMTAAYVLHSDALLANFGEKWAENEDAPPGEFTLLSRASDSLSKCLAGCPKDAEFQIVGERIDTIKAFTNYFEKQKAGQTASTADVSQNKTDLKITAKPKPQYTDAARQNNVTGKVRLAVFFGADGKTKHIIPLKSLRFGLTDEAIKAARAIAFEPERIDGKSVSVVKVVVFGFEIY